MHLERFNKASLSKTFYLICFPFIFIFSGSGMYWGKKQHWSVAMSVMGGGRRRDAWGSGKGESGWLMCYGRLELRAERVVKWKVIRLGAPDEWSGRRISPGGWSRVMPGIGVLTRQYVWSLFISQPRPFLWSTHQPLSASRSGELAGTTVPWLLLTVLLFTLIICILEPPAASLPPHHKPEDHFEPALSPDLSEWAQVSPGSLAFGSHPCWADQTREVPACSF